MPASSVQLRSPIPVLVCQALHFFVEFFINIVVFLLEFFSKKCDWDIRHKTRFKPRYIPTTVSNAAPLCIGTTCYEFGIVASDDSSLTQYRRSKRPNRLFTVLWKEVRQRFQWQDYLSCPNFALTCTQWRNSSSKCGARESTPLPKGVSILLTFLVLFLLVTQLILPDPRIASRRNPDILLV